MQLLKHREDAMDVVQDSLQKLVHGGQFNEKLGANAVIGLQFQTSVVMEGAAEMMAFGTAVVVEDV